MKRKQVLYFRFLSGDINWQEHGGLFMSRKLHNGDWPYWLIMEIQNGKDLGESDDYHVSIAAVSPVAAKARLHEALMALGFNEENELVDDIDRVHALYDYGIYALLHAASGNSLQKLMREARRTAFIKNSLFGFTMDAPLNKIGMSGWDCIEGVTVKDFLDKA